MVRPNSTVWNHYIIEFLEGNKKTVKCKYCQKMYTAPNATKMSQHLQKCEKKPITITVPVTPNLESEPYDAMTESQQSPDHKTSVWNHYTVMLLGGKKVAKCKYCQTKYRILNAKKMGKHLQKCSKKPVKMTVPVTPNLENEYYGVIVESQPSLETENMHIDVDPSLSEPSLITASCTELSGQNFPRGFDSITKTESEKLDAAYAKAIYSSNVPLSLTENSYWEQFFKKLRPSYRVPSLHDLTNRLLDKEYEDVIQFVYEEINKADFVTIVTGGWSNICNEGLVSYIVTTPTPLFFKSIEIQEDHHTSKYISDELMEIIRQVGDQKVTALVTDNLSNMKGAGKIIQEQYPKIFTVGCAVQGLNMLLGDISEIKTFRMIILKAKEVIQYVKNNQALLSAFTSKQKLKKGSAASTLKLPSESRWCNTLNMFESLLNGKESLQEAVNIEELDIDEEIRHLVLNDDIFWASIHSLLNVLSPVCNGIAMIESDDATLSDVPHVFFTIKKSLASLTSTPLQMEEEEAIKNMVETHREMFCQPIHYAAYVLDPRYAENELDVDDFKSAIDLITHFPIDESAAKIIADFALYKSHHSVYENNAVWESAKLISPFMWWKGFFGAQCLSSVALRIFNIPPSSAACERIFSAFSKTHTSVRNRLSNEKVSKLVAIKYNLILKSKQSFELINEND